MSYNKSLFVCLFAEAVSEVLLFLYYWKIFYFIFILLFFLLTNIESRPPPLCRGGVGSVLLLGEKKADIESRYLFIY